MKSSVIKLSSLHLAAIVLAFVTSIWGQNSPSNSGPITLTLQGYELSTKEASELLAGLSPNMDAKALLLQASGLAAKGQGKIVKLPESTAASGARGQGQEGAMKLETSMTLGADRQTVQVVMSLSAQPQLIRTTFTAALNSIAFLGSFDGDAPGKVTLVFGRLASM